MSKATKNKLGTWRSLLAGGIAGALEININMPFEFIKTQMQIYEHLSDKGMIYAAKRSMRLHGIRSRDIICAPWLML